MGLINTLRFIINHPLNADHRLKALSRFLFWQIGSRMVQGKVAVNFVNDSLLLASHGMPGANLNLYAGLHEFEHMSFVLHALRKEDLFIDVGANIGSYTILASASIGAKSISIEPISGTFKHLLSNVNLNGVGGNVKCLNIALGSKNGTVRMTSKLDCLNHVIRNEEETALATDVPVHKLDDIAGTLDPVLIKIDVEGYEVDVLEGGDEVLSKTSILAVIIELTSGVRRYGRNIIEVHKKMLDYGFKSYGYNPFKRELKPLNGINNNCENTLYLKDFLAVNQRVRSAPSFVVNDRKI